MVVWWWGKGCAMAAVVQSVQSGLRGQVLNARLQAAIGTESLMRCCTPSLPAPSHTSGFRQPVWAPPVMVSADPCPSRPYTRNTLPLQVKRDEALQLQSRLEAVEALVGERKKVLGSDVVEPAVRVAMAPAYSGAAQERGTGCFMRMKAHVEAHVDECGTDMLIGATSEFLGCRLELPSVLVAKALPMHRTTGTCCDGLRGVAKGEWAQRVGRAARRGRQSLGELCGPPVKGACASVRLAALQGRARAWVAV